MADTSMKFGKDSAGRLLSNDLSSVVSSADISEILKNMRTSKSLTIKKVANDIKIRTTFLNNIENNEFDKLPGYVYAVGFTRMYAAYLGLDSNLVVSTLKSLPDFVDQDKDLKEDHLPNSVNASGSSLTLFLSLFLVIMAGMLFGYFFSKQDSIENIFQNKDNSLEKVSKEKNSRESEEIVKNKSVEGFSFQ